MAFFAGNRVFAADINTGFLSPVASIYQSVGQNINNTTWTKVTLDTVSFDPNTVTDVSVNHRITPAVTGYYNVTINGCYNGNGTGGRFVAVYKNGAVVPGYTAGIPGVAATNGLTFGNAFPVQINNITDYIELWTWQNSGGALSTYSDPVNTCVLTISYDRALS